MNYRFFILVAGFFMFLFSQCTTNKNLVYLNNLPDGYETISVEKAYEEYSLQTGDMVYVRILSINKELNELFNIDNNMAQNAYVNDVSINLRGFTIDQNGYIRLPIIDTVKIKDLKISEAEALIQNKVNDFFKNATVILKPLNNKISVLGEVNRPGQFVMYKNSINVLEAIAMAGDVNQYGNKKSIIIVRTLENKSNISFRIDLTDKDILSNLNFYLKPNDIVIVEPLKLKSLRVNSPTISLILSGIGTIVSAVNMYYIITK